MAVTSAALATGQNQPIQTQSPYKIVPRTSNPKNIIICAANGYNYIDRGYEKLRQGADTLDAALAVVSGPEDDPNDDSVGLGGLPNEEGVVELDSCLMHGPTRRAGAVGALHDIKNASAVAKAVMEHTGHVMLVGEGATRFGLDMGFPKENLLTEHSRKIWMLWKETHSNQDWWGPGMGDPGWKPPAPLDTAVLKEKPRQIQKMYAAAADLGIPEQDRMDAIYKVLYPPTGTINCSVLNEKGEMSSVTTTSGLAWKIPGRCGDSPIIGAGCYCDQDVGAAGATGNGEENIKIAGAHTIVENMRHGMSPEEAGMDALRRVAHIYNNDMTKLAYVSMFYYVLRRDGAYAGVSLWGQPGPGQHPRQFAVNDGSKRLEHAKYLFQGAAKDWPPMPSLPK
jgi:N4-(beta-N-acetylglucosaminyl)-L-asparaginase